MATKPKADLGDLVVPKGLPAPEQVTPAATPGAGSTAHTLSLRLTGEQYRRLRRFVAAQEDQHGQRVTHQSIIASALADYLERHGG